MGGDVLFQTIERFHGIRPWGKFLDAGTGLHSVQWLQTIPTSSWTAITADDNMRGQIISDLGTAAKIRPQDEIIVGNWMDENFTANLGQYDTILADYLIGAVDGFSPYEQDVIIKKLKQHLVPNGRLYLIGMNPIPDEIRPPASIISEIRRARDACILLGGHRPYREFPLSWIKRHIEQSGMCLIDSKSYSILHSEDSAVRQIKVARSKLSLMTDKSLKIGMETYLDDLENRTRAAVRGNGGKIPLSFDYVIAVEHAHGTDVQSSEELGGIFRFVDGAGSAPPSAQKSEQAST